MEVIVTWEDTLPLKTQELGEGWGSEALVTLNPGSEILSHVLLELRSSCDSILSILDSHGNHLVDFILSAGQFVVVIWHLRGWSDHVSKVYIWIGMKSPKIVTLHSIACDNLAGSESDLPGNVISSVNLLKITLSSGNHINCDVAVIVDHLLALVNHRENVQVVDGTSVVVVIISNLDWLVDTCI